MPFIDGTPTVLPESRQALSLDQSSPASNTAASIVLGAQVGLCNVLAGFVVSYTGSGTLAGGNVSVTDGAGNTIFSIDINAMGVYSFQFVTPKRGSPNTAMTITLAAGSANVTGKVSLLGHWTEPPTTSLQTGMLGVMDGSQAAESMMIAAM